MTPTPDPPPAGNPPGSTLTAEESNNPLNLDCWFEGDEIVCASGERIPRHKWYPVAIESGAPATRDAPLTAEEIAAIRALNAQRDSECPWLMRTAEIRWQLERVARDAIIPALDMIEARDRENEALRDRLARAEARECNLRAALKACNCAECLLDEQRMSALSATPTAPSDDAARAGDAAGDEGGSDAQ